jgi:predicted house-cleaning noncanonical NTP pyrophosphatase (MazG superfamily)
MTQIKSDLICEIIRKSQTRFLNKKGWTAERSEVCEQSVLEWVKNNAGGYRNHYKQQLEAYSTGELSEFLKCLNETDKDLEDILNTAPAFVEK